MTAEDLSKLSFVPDPAEPTGNGQPSVAVVYTDDSGVFKLGLNINLHGGLMRGVHSNPSPSERRDELIVQNNGRLDFAD